MLFTHANSGFQLRDNDATAPAEFPPEQPEADLQADEEEYGADEADLDEDIAEEGAAEAIGESSATNNEDAAMAGAVHGEHGPDDDDMSEDGSVDIEGESEDEEEEEGAPEEGAADADDMDVDMGDAPDGHSHSEVMAH